MQFSIIYRNPLLLFAIFCSLSLYSQQLQPEVNLFDESPYYNFAFIKKNKIRSITTKISTKKSNDIIRDFHRSAILYFDNSGLPTKEFTLQKQTSRTDSLYKSYKFNNGLLTEKIINDKTGYALHTYKYSKNGLLIEKEYSRVINTSTATNTFQAGRKTVISSERYLYDEISPTFTQKKCYNNENRLFKTQTNAYDSLGYHIKDVDNYIIGDRKIETTFIYNENGRLFQKITLNTKTEYLYDEVGNITEVNIYESSVHKTVIQYLYNELHLVSAKLSKDIKTQQIKIIKFHYAFY